MKLQYYSCYLTEGTRLDVKLFSTGGMSFSAVQRPVVHQTVETNFVHTTYSKHTSFEVFERQMQRNQYVR